MVCYVLDFNYSKLLSMKFFNIQERTSECPKAEVYSSIPETEEKGKTTVNVSFALNCTSSTLYFNLLQVRLYQKHVCKFDIFILVAQSKCWTIRQKHTKAALYLTLVVQRRMFLACNSNGPQQGVKAKKIQFKPGIYPSFLSALLIGPKSTLSRLLLETNIWNTYVFIPSFCLD